MTKPRKEKDCADRMAMVYILRNNGCTWYEIRDVMDYTSHSTAISAYKRCKMLIEAKDELILNTLKKLINYEYTNNQH